MSTYVRLTAADRMRLAEASVDLPQINYEHAGVLRFARYIRRGFTYAESVQYALAYCRNYTEQRKRRVAHDTGAE